MPALTVTIIQTDLIWENSGANLAQLEQKIKALEPGSQLVILPEMFNTGFSMRQELFAEEMTGDVITWMKKITAEKKIILTGSVMIRDQDKYYNRLIWMLPNGQFGFYNKRHLFAYGKEHEHFTPGANRFIASANGWKINLQVCYDLRFPAWSRQQPYEDEGGAKRPEYDVLIYVANWPEKRSHAWKSLLVARAIENQCYVIGVNRVGVDGSNIAYSGDSMIIDPLGEILYTCSGKEDIHTITLSKSDLDAVRSHFPFLNDADQFHFDA